MSRGRKSEWRPKREPFPRPVKSRILIVGEGNTEANYFKGIGADSRVRQWATLKVVAGKGGSAVATVKRAIGERDQEKRQGDGYDEIWCVIDVEILEKHHALPLKEARETAQREGIKLALSNPCFEYWLLLHFERSARSYSTTDKLRRDLNRAWKKIFGIAYEKNNHRIYEELASRRDIAIANASETLKSHVDSMKGVVACNPSTDVYVLVEHLLAGAPEETG